MEDSIQVEAAALPSHIAGLTQLLNAPPCERKDIAQEYPDAAFFLQVMQDRRQPCYELACICHNAYRAMMSGVSADSAKVMYDMECERYLTKHMWD